MAAITSSQLLAHIKANPKCTNRSIAAAFKLDPSSVAARTGLLYKQDLVTREVVSRTASNIAIFGYTYKDSQTVTMRKREKTQETVVKAVETHSVRPALLGENADKKSVIKSPFDTALSALASSLAETIVGQVKAHLAVELSKMLPEPVAAPAQPTVSVEEIMARVSKPLALPKPKLPKVLITGLTPIQRGEIAKDFQDVFDLSFWSAEEGGLAKFKSMVEFKDVVFNHTHHGSHATEDCVKSAGVRLVRVAGGVSAMKDALTRYYVEVAE